MADSPYKIVWHIEPQFSPRVRKRALGALARRALKAEGAAAPSEISIVVTDDETVRMLNRRFRGIAESTDVLSFQMGEDESFVTASGSAPLLGEVVISYETAARQADEAGLAVEDELSHLLVHGVLHLLGHDHESAADAEAMRAREESLLGRAAH